MRFRSIIPILISWAALFAGCNGDKTTEPSGDGGEGVSCAGDSSAVIDTTAIADFSLTDVNAGSSTFGKEVSPRQYLQKYSAWYFGNST